jgi:capsular polysaccharide biosynthesis protein
MDIMESLRILRRRWILTVIMLLVVLGGTAAAALKLPRTYESDSTVVLLASRNASKPNGGNPYLSFNSSLPLTADVVRRELMDPRTVQALKDEGYGEMYAVAAATDTSGPVLLVTVTGPNKPAVERTVYGVTSEIGLKLAALQSTVTPANQITVVTLSVDRHATLSISKLARPVVVLFGLGIVIALAVPLIVDAQSTRRSRKKGILPSQEEVTPEWISVKPNSADKVATAERRTERQPMPRAPQYAESAMRDQSARGRRYSEPTREGRDAREGRDGREARGARDGREARYPDAARDRRYGQPTQEPQVEPRREPWVEPRLESRPSPNRAD